MVSGFQVLHKECNLSGASNVKPDHCSFTSCVSGELKVKRALGLQILQKERSFLEHFLTIPLTQRTRNGSDSKNVKRKDSNGKLVL